MRKKLNVNLIVFTLLSFFTISLVVKAQEYNYDLVPYDVSEVCPEFDEYEEYTYNCWDKYLEGELDSKKITNGLIEPGQKIMVLVNIDPSEDSEVIYMQLVLDYDGTILNSSQSSYINDINIEGKNGGIFPPKPGSTRKTDWRGSDLYNENRIFLEIEDLAMVSPVKTSGTMVALFFEVADDATPGTKTSITFNKKSSLASGLPDIRSLTGYASFRNLELTVS